MDSAFGVVFKKYLSKPKVSKVFSYVVFLRSSIVLDFYIISKIHFELVFVYCKGYG